MTIHIAANTGCNLGCSYCYEEPDREIKQEEIDNEYDIEKIFERLEDWKERYPGQTPGLHGGEPLLIRDEHLERIFAWIDENYDTDRGRSPSIQTNGTLIEDHHVELFEEYNVSVGMSVDGPRELNDERMARAGGHDVTRRMTERTHDALERLVENENIGVGVIVVLHETNAGTDERLEKLLDWLDWLTKHDVGGHYNPAIPYEDVQEDISLSPERLKEVYLRTWEWTKEKPYRRWDPMRQFQDNLLGAKLGNCVNQTCDVFNADAARIIKGNGESTGCGKTWDTAGDGTPFLQGPRTGNEYEETEERYEMLKQTPGPFTEEVQNGEIEDQGGCKGCPYWNVCQGGCPSSGLEDDYRNRTRWCEAKAAAYGKIEADMRAMFPGLTLITDFPWNADLADRADERRLDIAPFAGIRPSDPGHSSVLGGEHREGEGIDRIEEVVAAGSFDETVKLYREMYGGENVTVDPQNGQVHADTGHASPSENGDTSGGE